MSTHSSQATINELIAGSFGGAAQVLVGQPLDTIKTRAQIAPSQLVLSVLEIFYPLPQRACLWVHTFNDYSTEGKLSPRKDPWTFWPKHCGKRVFSLYTKVFFSSLFQPLLRLERSTFRNVKSPSRYCWCQLAPFRCVWHLKTNHLALSRSFTETDSCCRCYGRCSQCYTCESW